MINPRSKTAGRKDCGSWVPVVRPPQPPPLEVPTCPGTQHGSSDTLLEILLGVQQQMTLLQQQLAAQQQQQLARPLNYFLALKEVNAPNFAGSQDPFEAERWITEMEKFCRALCIPKDEWVNVTIPFLIADAEAWFISVSHAYESGGVRIGWAQFQDNFFSNFFPATFRIEKEKEFVNLKQGSMTVIQYASMFNQLGRFAPSFMVQEHSMVTRFEEGLNLNLREYMATPPATTYQEVLEQALRAERLIKSEKVAAQGHGMSSMKKPSLPQIRRLQATSANEKAIQEDLDGSSARAQEDKKQIEALQRRIIQLEKDLEQKHALELDVERLRVQLNDMKKTEELQRLSIEKEAKLKDQANDQIEALHQRIIQLEKDVDEKHVLQLDVERLCVQLNDLKEEEELQQKFKDQANKRIESLNQRIIQLKKDLNQKHALQLNVERQLNDMKKAEVQHKLSMKKAAELKDQANEQIEALSQRIIQLQKDLNQKHTLQLYVEQLRRQLQNKTVALHNLLTEKEAAELKERISVNRDLIGKEPNSNVQLHDALKEAIIEELDNILFKEAVKRKYKVEAELVEKAIELCFMWSYKISCNSRSFIWYPRKLVRGIGEDYEEVFDEDDLWLNDMKAKHGDAVHNIVITALCAINGYNPNGRLITTEWSIRERLDTLKKGLGILQGALFRLKGIYDVTDEDEDEE